MSDDLWPQYADDDGFGDFTISNRDRALVLIGEVDLEAQLLAIRSLLHRNRQADEALTADIQNVAKTIPTTRGPYAQHLVDQWVDEMHGSVFQGAAHSMSTVGMLAPFIESLFVAIFSHLGKREAGIKTASGPATVASSAHLWDPHDVERAGKMKKDGLVNGIVRLSHSTRLASYLPNDLEAVLTALFSYRHKMFHHGFEWPEHEREKFQRRIAEKGWTDWFSNSSHDHKPWVFYMRASFIEHCLTTIDQVLEGLGKYLEDRPLNPP